MTTKDLYEALSEPFDVTFSDTRGGVNLTYITGEQVVSRLNDVLGVNGWSFVVVEHGINADADECWVLGTLSATINGETVTKQQFGSQKSKRSRQTGTLLDLGFDLKGAATDALKKCATYLGVGLYLSKREPNRNVPVSNRSVPVSAQRTVSAQTGQTARCLDCGRTNLAGGGIIDTRTLCGDCYKLRREP